MISQIEGFCNEEKMTTISSPIFDILHDGYLPLGYAFLHIKNSFISYIPSFPDH